MVTLPPAPRSAETRDALIAAATVEFAARGFDSVSTREIAARAGANQALISYHFGGKEGLYLAVFEAMAAQIGKRIDPFVGAIDAHLETAPAGRSSRRVRDESLRLLLQLLDGMASLVADEASAAWGQLIVREQQNPTPAFNVVYERFMGRVLRALTALLHLIRPQTSEAEARLIVVTCVGQVFAFRTARAGILRHLGWRTIGPDELTAIRRRIRSNVTAMLLAKDGS
jgi:AcrR family transcriptional regulator